MFTVNNLLRTYKGKPVGISIHFDGCDRITIGERVLINGAVHGYFAKAGKIPKNVRSCGVKRWTIESGISINCDISARISGKLTVASLCGTCANKDIFVSINGTGKKHIYSMHPAKDSKLIRCWWIDKEGILQIRTWPWRAK